MCCAVEVGLFIFGVITLAKGRYVSRNRVIEGAPAYLIGVILVMIVPFNFLIGLVFGVVWTIRNGAPPNVNQMPWAAGIEAFVVLLALVSVMLIGAIAGKSKDELSLPFAGPPLHPPFRPIDPDNPYAAPQADERE